MKRMKPNTNCFYSLSLQRIVFIDNRTMHERKRWWTKARVPGVTRKSRMPGGSSFRGHDVWEG